MPHAVDPGVFNVRLCVSKQKSRSHLALFETVENGSQPHRQTEHHNAFGYLGQSIFTPSNSCHQLVRSSPESVFWRLSDEPVRTSTKARNESSAIFAIMGVDQPFCHSPDREAPGRCNRQSPTIAREAFQPFSPLSTSTPFGYFSKSPLSVSTMSEQENVSSIFVHFSHLPIPRPN